jgi:hypothetical protein
MNPNTTMRLTLAAIVRALFVAAMFLATSLASPLQAADGQRAEAKATATNAKPDTGQLGPAPVVVNVVTGNRGEADSAKGPQSENDKSHEEKRIADATVALAAITAALALFTGLLWAATLRLARDAKEVSTRQAKEMQTSIAEAGRSASAMESVAEATKNNALLMQGVMQKQMRAYLVIDIAGGIYQDSTKPFGVLPSLSNSGFTPAHDMYYWARAAVLPFPLPDGHAFPVPDNPSKSSMVIGPRQSLQLNAYVDNRVPDDDINSIKTGINRRVYVWGKITYKDIFGDDHTTEFCHSIFWLGPEGNQIMGTYDYHHNKAT